MINPNSKNELIHIIENMSEDELLKVKRFIEKEIYPSVKPFMKVSDLLNSGLVGLWKDRTDITDSSDYARKLREHKMEDYLKIQDEIYKDMSLEQVYEEATEHWEKNKQKWAGMEDE